MLGALRQVSYLISPREEGSKVSGSDTTTTSSSPLSLLLCYFLKLKDIVVYINVCKVPK